MSDWKTLIELGAEDQQRAIALFTDDELLNRGVKMDDYQFSEFGNKMLRRVDPATMATEKVPAVAKAKRSERADRTDTGQAESAVEMVDKVVDVVLAVIELCPLNPRKKYEEKSLNELADSIREHGIIQPLICRTKGSGYEVIDGHRRRLAGAIAELSTAPIILREMDDRTALDVMLASNLQRVDLNPIEEAEALKSWLALGEPDGSPRTIAMASARHSKDPRHILNILRLLRLPKKAREALESGSISGRLGIVLASPPTMEIRTRLTEEALKGFGGGPMSEREAREHVRRNYMVELRGSPFDQKNATLVPIKEKDGERIAGGACTDCPWNTAHMPDADDGRIHLCTNPGCYQSKVEVHVKHVKEKALAEGMLVIEGEKSKRYVYHDGTPTYDSGMVKLDQSPSQAEVVGGRKPPKWGKMLEGEVKPKTTLVIDERGRPHEMVERKLAIEAAKKNGFEDIFNARATRAKSSGHAEQLARESAEKEKQKLESRLAVLGLEELCSQIAKEGVAWPPMLELGLFHAGSDGEAFICHRREIEVTKGEHGQPEREKALRKYAATLASERLPAFIVELLLAGWMKHRGVEAPGFVGLAGAYEIDVKALRAKAKAEVAEKAKPKSAKKAKAAPEPVREKILRMGKARGMTPGAYEMMASHVLGKPFEGKPFENARGDELNFILEKLQLLSEHDPADGWIPHDEALMCPRCGTEFKNPPGDVPQVACAPACKYSGKVPRPYFKGKGKKGGAK